MKETNMEHYRGEIEEAGYEFGLFDGKVIKCHTRSCTGCKFFETSRCLQSVVKWLMSEYKPEPVLTAREKGFVEFVQKGWLAREKYKHGGIYYYFDKPTKECATWGVDGCAGVYLDKFGDNLFPFITWEDEEPWAVSDLRKLKALEYNPEDVAFKRGEQE